jgi:hypothetical protein
MTTDQEAVTVRNAPLWSQYLMLACILAFLLIGSTKGPFGGALHFPLIGMLVATLVLHLYLVQRSKLTAEGGRITAGGRVIANSEDVVQVIETSGAARTRLLFKLRDGRSIRVRFSRWEELQRFLAAAGLAKDRHGAKSGD